MKIVILGGGPGGYVAAIRAAQLGADVTLIEKHALGGTCLNVGCIPTKVLLNTTDLYETLTSQGEMLGIKAKDLGVDWAQLQSRKNEVVATLVGGIGTLLESGNIELIRGAGKFLSKNEIEVTAEDGTVQRLAFDRAIIATGSEPTIFPIPGITLPGILTSDQLLGMEELPKSLCIVGGGVIGSEFASLFSRLGVKVTIVEMLDRIVANMDEEIVGYLAETLSQQDVDLMTRTKVERFEETPGGIRVVVTAEGGERSIEAEKVLLSIGRRPVIKNLGLEAIGVKTARGIEVDSQMRTSVSSICAIGDCTGGVMLAHVASAQGIVAVETLMGKRADVDFGTVPYCVYTRPEIAAVGLTEAQARSRGIEIEVGRFPLMGNGKAMILGEPEGLVKIVAERVTGQVLGVHMAGPKATELIVEGALALRLEATVEELLTTVHAHPTVGESLHEAAHAVFGKAIHLP